MVEAIAPPDDKPTTPGTPQDKKAEPPNELNRDKMTNNDNTSISTASTGARDYNIRQNSCYNYNDYNYNDYNYNSPSNSNNIVPRAPVAPQEMEVHKKIVVVSAGIPPELFLKLKERENITKRSRSEIIKEALLLYLNGDPNITNAPPPKPSLASQLMAEKNQQEFQDILTSLVKVLVSVRDMTCDRFWIKEWYMSWSKRLITTVQKLEPLSEPHEHLVQVMSQIAKELKDVDPQSDQAYGTAKSLLEKLKEALA